MKTKSPVGDIFLKTFPITELKGTVSKYAIQNTEKNKMYAKSGSMNRVRAYAGYIFNNKGEEIAFCVIANNYGCPGFRMRKIFEELFITISKLE
jgi:D-alanyl-D-alanine carboxypeptidase/D-alanyl-D-alanine-endopeptidase (penicillin-binding protein 4)